MPSREINVIDPDQTHARCEFSFFPPFFVSKENWFSFVSVNLPVRRSQ